MFQTRFHEKDLCPGFYILNKQVVAIFEDTQIAPFDYVKSSKQIDGSKWPLNINSTNISPTSQPPLLVHIPKMREDHVNSTSELARYSITR